MHLVRGENGRGQLAAPVPGHEHLAGLVDPDLLDLWIVEPPLQRPEASDGVQHGASDLTLVTDGWKRRGQRPVPVVSDDVVDDHSHPVRIAHRVDPATANQLANLRLDDLHGVRHDASPRLSVCTRTLHSRRPTQSCPAVATRSLEPRIGAQGKRFSKLWTTLRLSTGTKNAIDGGSGGTPTVGAVDSRARRPGRDASPPCWASGSTAPASPSPPTPSRGRRSHARSPGHRARLAPPVRRCSHRTTGTAPSKTGAHHSERG